MGTGLMPDGPDVSGFQPNVDWNAVAARYAFAIAKVSEGVGFEDPQWPRNGPALVAPGPLVGGGYHFARPDLGNQPEAEAEWFWNRVIARCGTAKGLLLALDLEAGSGDLSGWRDRFCSHLSGLAAGYTPGWYTYWDFALTRGLNAPTPYWGWFAWPDSNGALPAANFSISFQQYGLDPLTGGDINRFFGDLSQLKALTVGGAADSQEGDTGMLVGHPSPAHVGRFDFLRVVNGELIRHYNNGAWLDTAAGLAGAAAAGRGWDYGSPGVKLAPLTVGAAWVLSDQDGWLVMTVLDVTGHAWGIQHSYADMQAGRGPSAWIPLNLIGDLGVPGPPGPPGPNTDQALRAYLKSGPG